MKVAVFAFLGSLVHVASLGAQGSATESTESCFLTPAEVEAVSGEKVLGRPRGQLRDLMGLKSYRCRYRGDNFTVEVSLESGRSREDLQLYLKMLGAVAQGATKNSLQPVKGLGDQAWWGQINPTNGSLHIVRGTDVLTVQTYGKAPGAGTQEKTRALADKAFAAYVKTRK
jgi:hypothetical protein